MLRHMQRWPTSTVERAAAAVAAGCSPAAPQTHRGLGDGLLLALPASGERHGRVAAPRGGARCAPGASGWPATLQGGPRACGRAAGAAGQARGRAGASRGRGPTSAGGQRCRGQLPAVCWDAWLGRGMHGELIAERTGSAFEYRAPSSLGTALDAGGWLPQTSSELLVTDARVPTHQTASAQPGSRGGKMQRRRTTGRVAMPPPCPAREPKAAAPPTCRLLSRSCHQRHHLHLRPHPRASGCLREHARLSESPSDPPQPLGAPHFAPARQVRDPQQPAPVAAAAGMPQTRTQVQRLSPGPAARLRGLAPLPSGSACHADS